MMGLALGVLIAIGVASLWDLLDPNALKLEINSAARGVFALVSGVASVTLALLVLHAAVTTFVLVFVVLLALACFRVAIDA